MSLSALSSKKVEVLDDTICTRARINTGPFCNYSCNFCYYKDQLSNRRPLKEIYEQIDLAKNYGMTSVDFSGGESSVEPNWFKILDYANDRFEYLSCLSHGGKFANMEFLKKSQKHGLKEILFSIHGQTPEVHDKITERKGSFKRIIQAVHNAHELGILVRINCTISLENYKNIDTGVLKSLNPLQINFIVVNYWGDNRHETNTIDYKDMSTYLHQYLDELTSVDYINVRYIPLCYMKGYEKYVIDYMQLPFDLYDWNIAHYFQDDKGGMLTKDKVKDLYNTAEVQRVSSYDKPLECLKCKHFYICDGVEKGLDMPVYPVKGDKITDPIHYCRNNMIKENPH